MFKLLILLVLSHTSLADSKYDEAITVATKAAFKQSGLEDQVMLIADKATNNTTKWLKHNHLGVVVAVATLAVPVLIRKQVEIHSGDFSLVGKLDKKELIWMKRF